MDARVSTRRLGAKSVCVRMPLQIRALGVGSSSTQCALSEEKGRLGLCP